MLRRTFRVFGRTMTIERGGQSTQWPWTSITFGRHRPRPHACGATMPMVSNPGWTCDGSNLVVPRDKDGIRLGTAHAPCVIREDLIPRADPAVQRIIAEGGTESFKGGDHLHLTVGPPE